MHGQHILPAAGIGILVMCLGLSAAQGVPAGQAGQERFVTVNLSPKADLGAVLAALKANGFRPLTPLSPADELRGTLPEAAAGNVLKLPGVDRLILGSPVAPPPAVQQYEVRLRFSINPESPREFELPIDPKKPPPKEPPRVDWQRRKVLYDQLMTHLRAAKFQHQPKFEDEWKYSDLLFGTVPAEGGTALAVAPNVRTVLLVPQGYDLSVRQTLLVEIQLSGGFGVLAQHEVAARARALLESLSFREAVGYDRRGHTRLLGWLPADKLNGLLDPGLVMDVPISGTQPPVVGAVNRYRIQPIRRVEVLREPAGQEAPSPPAEIAPPHADHLFLEKLSVDLRGMLGPDGMPLNPGVLRVEVLVRGDVDLPTRVLTSQLREIARTFEPEGRMGPLVGGMVDAAELAALARSPLVSTLRLPQPALLPALPPMDGKRPERANFDFVSLFRPTLGARDLGELIRRRSPVRIAVVSSDFRGAQKLIEVRLPPRTHLFDFTPARDKDLQPEPLAGDTSQLGHGTRLALAVLETTPVDELFLLRISADAPYQVQDILDRLEGSAWRPESLLHRERELQRERALMDREKLDLRLERGVLLKTFREDEEYKKARDAYLKKEADLQRREKLLIERTNRLVRQFEMGQALRDVGTVVVGLDWPDGQPRLPEERGGLRWLRGGPNLSASWVHAVPKLSGQRWVRLFRDDDADGVMEFAPFDRAAGGRADLNYLLWQPHPWLQGGATNLYATHLPGKTVVRVTLQWREAHLPEWKREGNEDHYRQAISPFRIVVLKQRDPTGQLLPVDTFEIVARSQGWADRLEDHPRYGIYQQTVRFIVPEEGRYAIRLEGKNPDSTLPVGVVRSGRLERFELYPQLQVEVINPLARGQGRVVLEQ